MLPRRSFIERRSMGDAGVDNLGTVATPRGESIN